MTAIVKLLSASDLPDWNDCEAAVDGERATELQRFIFNHQPSERVQYWRNDLVKLLNNYAENTEHNQGIVQLPSQEKVLEAAAEGIKLCMRLVHVANKKWWVDINTEEPIKRNVGELLVLHISEIVEAGEDSPEYFFLLMELTKTLCRAMEGHRKSKMDDKLPDRTMFEVELADLAIRLFDMAEGLDVDLPGAFIDKMKFNAIRPDHKLEHRRGEGGKKY